MPFSFFLKEGYIMDSETLKELVRLYENFERDAIDMLSFVDNASNAAIEVLRDRMVELDVVNDEEEYKKVEQAYHVNSDVAFRVRMMLEKHDRELSQLIKNANRECQDLGEIRSRLVCLK